MRKNERETRKKYISRTCKLFKINNFLFSHKTVTCLPHRVSFSVRIDGKRDRLRYNRQSLIALPRRGCFRRAAAKSTPTWHANLAGFGLNTRLTENKIRHGGATDNVADVRTNPLAGELSWRLPGLGGGSVHPFTFSPGLVTRLESSEH